MTPTRAQAIASTVRIGAAGILFSGARTVALAQTPLTVRVGSGNVEPNAQVFYALDARFFKKAGVDAQLTILRSGGVTMEAIVAGQLDAGVSNTVSLGSALLRKIPFVVIAPGIFWDARSPNAAIIVAAKSPIANAKDLNGQNVAVTSLNSVDGLGVDSYMAKNGGDYTSVKYIELVPSAQAEAVASGRVAAGVLNDPELSTALAAGSVRKLVDAYDAIARLYYTTAWLCSADWLSKNKEAAKRFADAIVAAGAWSETHRPEALNILAKYTKFHENTSNARYGRTLDPNLLQPVFDAAYTYKLYPAPLRAASYCWDGK